jgi:hypothetical protein
MAPKLASNVLSNCYDKILESLNNLINDDDFICRHRRSPKAFIRKRCLTFRIMILLLVNMLKGSVHDELDHFFKAINLAKQWERVVTKSAFSQALRNLDPLAFVVLNNHLVRSFYNTFSSRTFMGFTLLAVDGSTVKVPHNQENIKHFGAWQTDAGPECPGARVSQVFDVLNKITIAAVISPKSKGERDLASEHFLNLRPLDLVLLDRGYPAFWIFKLITNVGSNFCARISDHHWSVVKAFKNSGQMEDTLTFTASCPARKACRELGLDFKPIKLRLVRVALDTGETEILITSLLDRQSYPHDCFAELYHHRWPVEEGYNHMKHRLEIENFTGKSPLTVYQDFHAKVLTKNLAAILAHSGQDQVDLETVNRKQAHQKLAYFRG